jgi:carbamoyltransferase
VHWRLLFIPYSSFLKTAILGISAFYHDSAACLLIDGEIIAAAQEERFSRIKHDASFPKSAIQYVLGEGGIEYNDLTAISFYDKPLLKFERLLENYHSFVPRGISGFLTSVPVWIKEKLFMRKFLRGYLDEFSKKEIRLLFPEHHLSHAASAFYPSPFEEAAILTVDGVGEWATTTICHGKSNQITILRQLDYPHSLGLLYASFTYYLGFKVNSSEYKVMGLAPYGNPDSEQTLAFKEKILQELMDLREDGSILMNMDYFDFAISVRMTNNNKWERLFGMPPRKPESSISQSHMNLALAIQQVTDLCMVSLATTARKITGCKNLVMAGGVALNCVANSKIAEAGLFEQIWIQPASGDAGGSVGSAYAAFHIWNKNPRIISYPDAMKAAFLGPEYGDKEILNIIRKYDLVFKYYSDFNELCTIIARKLAEGKVVGWFQGRMEFGPRALGNRSILADPGNPEMQKTLNLKIKFREGFRPFAPAVLTEDLDEYFESGIASPYMMFVSKLRKKWRYPDQQKDFETQMSNQFQRTTSFFPAVIHLDYSARTQTVDRNVHPRFWQLITEFKRITGRGMIINTSFNVRGEPIVCSPTDAWQGFLRTEMDFLVLGNYVFDKKEQKEQSFTEGLEKRFDPD